MKVIDLYNKIANREEVPSIIEYKNERYFYNNETHQYYSKITSNYEYSLRIKLCDLYDLNDEIEIIEDKQKKIKKFEFSKENTIIDEDLQDIKNKLNELIDYINSKED